MGLSDHTAMDDAAIDDILQRKATGVLSFGGDGAPYSIPVSYGYDPETSRLFFRLVSSQDSTKRRYLGNNPIVTFVVYEVIEHEEGITYQSVIAKGLLEHIERASMTVDHIEQFGHAKRPLFDLWDEPSHDLEVLFYVLEPEQLSGRSVSVPSESE